MLTPETCPPLDISQYEASQPGQFETALCRVAAFVSGNRIGACLFLLCAAGLFMWRPVGALIFVAIFNLFYSGPDFVSRRRLARDLKPAEIQLANRSSEAVQTWATYRGGNDPAFQSFARHCCLILTWETGWISDRFVPWDTVSAIFTPVGSAGTQRFLKRLDFEYGLKVTPEDLSKYEGATWADFLASCYDRKQESKRQFPVEATTPAEATMKSC